MGQILHSTDHLWTLAIWPLRQPLCALAIPKFHNVEWISDPWKTATRISGWKSFQYWAQIWQKFEYSNHKTHWTLWQIGQPIYKAGTPNCVSTEKVGCPEHPEFVWSSCTSANLVCKNASPICTRWTRFISKIISIAKQEQKGLFNLMHSEQWDR